MLFFLPKKTLVFSCSIFMLVVFSHSVQAILPDPFNETITSLQRLAPNTLSVEQQNIVNICNRIKILDDNVNDRAIAGLRHEEVATQGTAVLKTAKKHTNNVNARIDALQQPTSSSDTSNNELLANSRWGFFSNGGYNSGDRIQTVAISGTSSALDGTQSVTEGERAVDFNGREFSAGLDYRFPNEKMVLGTAFGYNQQKSNFTNQAGKTDVDGYSLSLYGTYLPSEKIYLDGIISIAQNDINASRPVPVFDNNVLINNEGRAFTDTNSQQVSASLGAGYEFNRRAWNIAPFARFDYTKTNIDAYTETVLDNGANNRDSRGLILAVEDQRINSFIGSLGVRTSYAISTANGVFIPQASLEFKHQFKNDKRLINASLPAAAGITGITSTPGTQTAEVDRNYMTVGIGVSALFANGHSGFIHIDSLQGNDDISDTAIKIGYRKEF